MFSFVLANLSLQLDVDITNTNLASRTRYLYGFNSLASDTTSVQTVSGFVALHGLFRTAQTDLPWPTSSASLSDIYSVNATLDKLR